MRTEDSRPALQEVRRKEGGTIVQGYDLRESYLLGEEGHGRVERRLVICVVAVDPVLFADATKEGEGEGEGEREQERERERGGEREGEGEGKGAEESELKEDKPG